MKSKSKVVGTIATLIIAFTILSVSVLKSATTKYAYSPMVLSEKIESESDPKINYLLAYPGKIHPDNPF